MNIWNRIQYRLLRWLLNDICEKSKCEECVCSHEVEILGYSGYACSEPDIFYQAWNVWGPEDKEEEC